MKEKYRKKINLVNNTGYTPGYSSEKNPVNYIPSENITMKNTPYPIFGQAVDSDGNPIGEKILMKPGGEYFFEGATYVKETPQNKMRSKKKYQFGGFKSPTSSLTQTEEQKAFEASKKAFNEANNIFGNIEPKLDFNTSAPSFSDYKRSQMSQEQRDSADLFARYRTGKMQDSTSTQTAVPQITSGKELFQFSNPYGDVDLGTSLTGLGSSLASGDTLGAVTYGASTLLNGSKSFMQGFGAANRSKQNMGSFYKNFRDNMVGDTTALSEGGYFQEGGQQMPEEMMAQLAEALQQGAQPEEVLQQLIESGVPQQQATQMIQQIMGQLQQQVEQQMMQTGGIAKGGTKAIAEYQKMLNQALGTNLTTDGAWGPRTQRAYEQYQQAEKIKSYKTNFQNEPPSFSPVVEARRQEDYSNPAMKKPYSVNFGDTQMAPFNMMSFGTRESGRGIIGNSSQEIRQGLKNQSQEQLYQDYMNAGLSSNEALKAVNKATDPRTMFQDGGEQMLAQEQAPQQDMQQDMQQVMSQVAQALQQGVPPEELLQQLISMGIPQEQAIQLIQEIMGQLQQGVSQQQESDNMMKNGGTYMDQLVGKKILGYTYNKNKDSYEVEFE